MITVGPQSKMMITKGRWRASREISQPSENKVFKDESGRLVDFVCLGTLLFCPAFAEIFAQSSWPRCITDVWLKLFAGNCASPHQSTPSRF